jgi:CheY-like chemotaxis protein
LSRLVEEMLQLLKISVSKRAVLQTDLPHALPVVHGNAAKVRQIVMNLIINASEAIGQKDGVISVSTSRVTIGQTRGAPETEYLRLEVADSGCGMTPETRARIFDPFFTTKFAGRGLGLAVVQGIVRSHSGAINVTSNLGQGSRFEILLPCVDQPVRDTVTVSPSARPTGRVPGTVLVIEEEEALRLAVSKMLRMEEFSVLEAGDGDTGARLFRTSESKIDVVLLDATMPGTSGREVLAELRQICPEIKIILTTALSQHQALSTMPELQSWGYIRKPYQFAELVSLIRTACLDRPGMTNSAAV